MTTRTRKINNRRIRSVSVSDSELTESKSNSNNSSNNSKVETVPLSPITSPDQKLSQNHPFNTSNPQLLPHLTPRQEQNRKAQRIFREKRAQTLREMEDRLSRLERVVEVISIQIHTRRMGEIEREIEKLKNGLGTLYGVVDSLTMPTWTVPNSDVIQQIDQNSTTVAILGALRPSSTDPTLTTTSHHSDQN